MHNSESGPMVGISLDESEVSHFYRRYCNSVLWPTLHGWTDDPLPEPADWDTYYAVNLRYTEAILRQLQPGDRVWVHDYHLLLVPRMLRERVPNVPVAFFLHTPFPEPAVFAHVPQSEKLLDGMLGANVIGFHTDAYARNFLAAVEAHGFRVRGNNVLDGKRRACVRTRPMGIDVDSFARLGTDPHVLAEVERIRNRETALLLGVDRLDYTKGIPQRLLAFECLLDEHPRLHGRVSFLQIAVPTREEITAYRDLREVVEELVRRINNRYGRPGWTPVDYLYGTVDVNTLASLYRAADVMVVTSRRDGLNLVAKEFIATRTDYDGVLILSKFAGAAQELTAALQVDPNRVGDLARVYYSALTMSDNERRSRMRELRRALENNGILQWAADFLDRLPGFAGVIPIPGVAALNAGPPEPTLQPT
jgi:trehalose 6-phosphate synthase/phosphatase